MSQIIKLVAFAFDFYILLLFARIIMSWIPLPASPVFKTVANFIYDVTEPVLGVFRRLLPMVNLGGMGLDLSPMLAFFALRLVKGLVLTILSQSFT